LPCKSYHPGNFQAFKISSRSDVAFFIAPNSHHYCVSGILQLKSVNAIVGLIIKNYQYKICMLTGINSLHIEFASLHGGFGGHHEAFATFFISLKVK